MSPELGRGSALASGSLRHLSGRANGRIQSAAVAVHCNDLLGDDDCALLTFIGRDNRCISN